MTMRVAAGIAGGVALLVAIMATLSLENQQPSPSVSAAEVSTPPAKEQSEVASRDAVLASASATIESTASISRQRPLPSAQLLDRYNGTGNRRQLAVQAWGKPVEGGRYYAAKIAGQCLAYRQFIETPGDPVARESDEAAAARNRLQESCDGFTDDELTHHYRLRPDNSLTDPVAVASRAISAASRSGSHADKLAAVQSVLHLGDPVLIDDLGIRLALHRNEIAGTYVFFEGTRYPVRDDPAIVPAFYLLPCALGLDCSSQDPALQLLCANTGRCYVDRFEKVAAETPGGRDGKRFTETMQWYGKLAAAVKRSDPSAFVDRP
jgi:hypothetical protein